MSKIYIQRVKVGSGFNPENPKHVDKVLPYVVEKAGPGEWTIQSYDPTTGVASFARGSIVDTVERIEGKHTYISIASTARESDADKYASRYEDQNPGKYMTEFSPSLQRMRLTELTDEEHKARRSLSSALRVKPWDIQIASRKGGGFVVDLHDGYVPKLHDEKIQYAIEDSIGKFGWYKKIDPLTLVCEIVPGEPPVFPKAVPYPPELIGTSTYAKSHIGSKLGEPGEENSQAWIDWENDNFAIVSGLPGSGKSVVNNCILYQWIDAGADCYVVDDKSKSVDFEWAKPYLAENGWGCDGLASSVAVLGYVRDKVKATGQLLRDNGWKNWREAPPGMITPQFIMMDEATALLATDKLPVGVPKDNPVVQEMIMDNTIKATISNHLKHIVAELRFVGVFMVVSQQVTNMNTGMPPTVKDLIGHRLLMGPRPSKNQKSQAFQVPEAVPDVPEYLASMKGVSKGVGTASIGGVGTFIVKGYWADTDTYAAALDKKGRRSGIDPTLSPAVIAKYDPTAEDGDGEFPDDGPPPSRLSSEGGFGHQPKEKPLRGAAAAAHALARDMAARKVT